MMVRGLQLWTDLLSPSGSSCWLAPEMFQWLRMLIANIETWVQTLPQVCHTGVCVMNVCVVSFVLFDLKKQLTRNFKRCDYQSRSSRFRIWVQLNNFQFDNIVQRRENWEHVLQVKLSPGGYLKKMFLCFCYHFKCMCFSGLHAVHLTLQVIGTDEFSFICILHTVNLP